MKSYKKKSNCLNYKFILQMQLPLACFALGLVFICISPGFWMGYWFSISALLIIVVLLSLEPIAYRIDEKEIVVISAFRKYYIPHKQIQKICVSRDAFFELLAIKDYILILEKKVKIPERCLRIMKYSQTQKLIEQYYEWKLKKNY